MSAGLVTVNNGFRRLKATSPVLFWPVAVAWVAFGGIGHGVAMHYLATALVILLYPLGAAALFWPLLVGTASNRLGGTINATLFAALFWWMSWVGWHVAEGGRQQGPFSGVDWAVAEGSVRDPYAFDGARGVAAGIAFATLTPAEWVPHFRALSEAKKIKEPRRRWRSSRSRPDSYFTPGELRWNWAWEPVVVWLMALMAVWPKHADRILVFGQYLKYLNPRRWGRRT